jgi:hypothetical protein
LKRIIIDYEYPMNAEAALSRVLKIVTNAPKSVAVVEGIPTEHYCWHTTMTDGSVVDVRRKRTRESADSFLVRIPITEDPQA